MDKVSLKSRIRDPYVRFCGRTGLTPLLPDFLARANRVASRIAEIGYEAWLGEIKTESPAFQSIAWAGNFYDSFLKEAFPQRSPKNVVSRTLGSIPLTAVAVTNERYFDFGPLKRRRFDGFDASRAQALFMTRGDLELAESLGFSFTPEELADPTLTALVAAVRVAESE